MAFSFLRRGAGADDRLDHVEVTIQQMLQDDCDAFNLAMEALLGEVDVQDIRKEVWATDERVNEGERMIRRELVVHASVSASVEAPALLLYMSVVKDIERVGDYAKNLLDLARDGASFASHPEWADVRSEVSALISDTKETFARRDTARARALIAAGDAMLDDYDDRVSALVRGHDDAPDAVARALALRYLKRIVAHLMNVLSSVVMPLDQLDYFDQDPEDRADRENR